MYMIINGKEYLSGLFGYSHVSLLFFCAFFFKSCSYVCMYVCACVK